MTQFNNSPKQARKIWTDALEAGRHKQGRECLERHIGGEIKRCCLGVAAYEFNQAEPENAVSVEPYGDEMTYDGTSIYLPLIVQEWLNIDSGQSPRFVNNDFPNGEFLTNLNDHGHSFLQIAKIIKEEPDGLFRRER